MFISYNLFGNGFDYEIFLNVHDMPTQVFAEIIIKLNTTNNQLSINQVDGKEMGVNKVYKIIKFIPVDAQSKIKKSFDNLFWLFIIELFISSDRCDKNEKKYFWMNAIFLNFVTEL